MPVQLLYPGNVGRLLWRGSLLPLGVGAVECNEAAIFPLTIESQAKDQDQKIAAFGSSYTQPSGSKLPRHEGMNAFHCGSLLAMTE